MKTCCPKRLLQDDEHLSNHRILVQLSHGCQEEEFSDPLMQISLEKDFNPFFVFFEAIEITI